MHKKYIVTEKWDASYENPIIVEEKEIVAVDLSKEISDPEWANWVWCIAANKMEGWVPAQILKITETISPQRQTAVVTENYSANELSVKDGDIVIGSRILNGWLWCNKENNETEGWIPVRNIRLINPI